jgi:hypothetical protein
VQYCAVSTIRYAPLIKGALLFSKGKTVLSVPYHLDD